MVLQSSGEIDIGDIAAEFGGTAPHSISEYYRGGGLVPDTGTNVNIPQSGEISLDDFYGGDVSVGGPSGGLYSMGMGGVWSFKENNWTTYDMLSSGWDGSNPSEPQRIRSTPTQIIDTSTNFDSVVGGGTGVMMHKTDGKLWTVSGWNDNVFPYGLDSTHQTIAQKGGSPVLLFSSADWSPNYCRYATNFYGIKNDGRLWCTGTTTAGYAAGDWTGTGTATTPSNVSAITHKSPVQIAGGGTTWERTGYGNATKTDGKFWTWGPGGSGIVSLYGRNGHTTNRDIYANSTSTPIQMGTDTNWADHTTAAFATTAIKNDGKMWAWGGRLTCALPQKSAPDDQLTPLQVGTDTNWAALVGPSLGVKNDGRLWNWYGGINQSGTNNNSVYTPTQIYGGGTNWSTERQEGRVGYFASRTALKTDGRAWMWIALQAQSTSGSSTNDSVTPDGTVYTNTQGVPDFVNTPVQLAGNRTDWIYAGEIVHNGTQYWIR
jgi:hypothetical protein